MIDGRSGEPAPPPDTWRCHRGGCDNPHPLWQSPTVGILGADARWRHYHTTCLKTGAPR